MNEMAIPLNTGVVSEEAPMETQHFHHHEAVISYQWKPCGELEIPLMSNSNELPT